MLEQLGHERFYAYIACTRARARVSLTTAARDSDGALLNPSSLVQHLKRLFPRLQMETFTLPPAWTESEHPSELMGPLLVNQAKKARGEGGDPGLDRFEELPLFAATLRRLDHLHAASQAPRLDPALAAQLYGPVLHTSVSSLEKFAACPFRFFVHSGLEAEERTRFLLDIRQQGSFQHEVLSRFHQHVMAEYGAWRNLSPDQAGEVVRQIAEEP
jgi:ATP-dependent helicase/nuclease subunit B